MLKVRCVAICDRCPSREEFDAVLRVYRPTAGLVVDINELPPGWESEPGVGYKCPACQVGIKVPNRSPDIKEHGV